MMKPYFIPKRFPKRIIFLVILLGGVLFNLLAYRHAYVMLHFTQHGKRTDKPESLSLWQKISVLFTGVNIPKPSNDSNPENWGLIYETHQFKVNNNTELEAWYIPHHHPQGFIVMFHGYATAKSSLLPEAQVFNEMGYAIFLVDFRGSGGSNRSDTSIGYYEADDVAAAVAYVQHQWENDDIILYGQSMGAVAILRAIAKNEVKPKRIILEAVFDKMLSTVANRFASMGLPAFPAAHTLIFWGSMSNGFSGFHHNPSDYAPHVTCPVLMLHGSVDERATLPQAQAVYSQIHSEKQFVIFEDVGHESYLVAHPEQWQTVLTQFLSK